MEIHLEETAVSGSFFSCAAAAASAEEAATADADVAMTAACGLSFSCAAAAALAETAAANPYFVREGTALAVPSPF